MKKSGAIMIAILFLATASPGYAQKEVNPPPEAAGAAKESAGTAKEDDRLPIHKQEQWQFFASPYMWIPGMTIDTTVSGHTSSVSESWYNMVPKLFSSAIGAMGRFEVWKGRWGIYVDSYFTYLDSTSSDSTGKTIDLGRRLHIPATLLLNGDLHLISRAASVDFGPRFLVGTLPLSADKPLPLLSLELLGGGRYTFYNQYIKLGLEASLVGPLQTRTAGGTFVNKIERSFLEPFLGMRLGLWINPKMLALLRFTVGGFGFATDNNLDLDMELDLGYKVHRNIYAYVGWRAHYVQCSQDAFSLNAWFNGPIMGAVFAF